MTATSGNARLTAQPTPAGRPFPADLANRVHRALEPLHAMTYFAPETEAALTGVGLRPGRMCYFAGRSAAMGAVGPGVVAATFYNFNPDLIARFIPRAWTLAAPAAVISARFDSAEAALSRLLGPMAESGEVTEAAELIRAATEGCTPEGRPLYAGHADLAWPSTTLMQLWHGVSLLREHRGDGHLAALLHAGLGGLEAIVTHTATGHGFLESAAKALRGWSDEQWAAAAGRLRSRGIFDADDALSAQGVELRRQVENDTDAMALAPWLHLGVERTSRLQELGRQLSTQIRRNGAFPAGVFATR